MQGRRLRRPGRCPGLTRAWGGKSPRSPLSRLARVSLAACRRCGRRRSYARRYRGSLALSPVPAWSVMSYAAPLRYVVGGATAPGRDRPSAALFPRASVLPPRYGLAHAACERKSTRHAKPSARPVRLRARLDAGLGKVRRWAAPLVLARWPRAALPPSAGGRSAGILAERFGCSAAACS